MRIYVKTELQNTCRNILNAFYGIIKSCGGQIRFAFLTGVTKFGKVSVFSDLNNLDDISMDPHYFDLCGISQADLHKYFDASVEELASVNGQTKQQAYDRLKADYDGYHFCEEVPGMYNPFSVLSTFRKNKYGYYWFETGTPTYLVELLKDYDSEFDLVTIGFPNREVEKGFLLFLLPYYTSLRRDSI